MSLSHCTLWGHAEGCGLLEDPSPQEASDMASQTSDTVTVSLSEHSPCSQGHFSPLIESAAPK